MIEQGQCISQKSKNLPKPLDKPYILRYNDGKKKKKNITILDYITKYHLKRFECEENMIKAVLKRNNILLTEFADSLNISRPTLDTYIRNYDSGVRLSNNLFQKIFDFLFITILLFSNLS